MPLGSEVVTKPKMLTVRFCVWLCAGVGVLASVTVTLKLNVPGEVVVPERTPVEELMLKPGGT